MNIPTSPRLCPFTILTRQKDNWKVDSELAERLREDAAFIRAKPAEIIAIRDVNPRQRSR
ncbi:MAG: hypothetical protein ACR2MF_00650 [Chthoniobacterales bacterium]